MYMPWNDKHVCVEIVRHRQNNEPLCPDCNYVWMVTTAAEHYEIMALGMEQFRLESRQEDKMDEIDKKVKEVSEKVARLNFWVDLKVRYNLYEIFMADDDDFDKRVEAFYLESLKPNNDKHHYLLHTHARLYEQSLDMWCVAEGCVLYHKGTVENVQDLIDGTLFCEAQKEEYLKADSERTSRRLSHDRLMTRRFALKMAVKNNRSKLQSSVVLDIAQRFEEYLTREEENG